MWAWITHAFGRTISVLCVLLFLGGIGWAIYAGIIRPVTKPNPTTTQNAKTINNYEYYPNKRVFGIGIDIFGLRIGIDKYAIPQAPVIIKEETQVDIKPIDVKPVKKGKKK